MKSWPEFADTKQFGAPNNLAERVQSNLSYFSVNYAILVAVVLVLSLVTGSGLVGGAVLALLVVGAHAALRKRSLENRAARLGDKIDAKVSGFTDKLEKKFS